ncbi:L-aspartate oxidase [Hathewaya proteolytica DSM 3090]|uniref:L-aspartate oxidase n=1 Tax=Hathewaya proteolytica DSM 3090 TaxID=1121331 RepID=A0A1M6SHF3_9CLOT|nr:L-aspartate oxidase [Hathewaya proteolytica]SHK44181.1 L-aspartate oxidase [Hathewaya proteolytica DSM 3090]
MKRKSDVLIIGAGVAGLYFALNLDSKLDITIITKESLGKCNSYLAQGGISTERDYNDRELYIEDTLRAGEYKNDLNAVKILIEESQPNINKLIELGVPFDRAGKELDYTREGAHSTFRIVHCKDETGKCVTETLIENIKKRKNINILEDVNVADLIVQQGKCIGAVGVRQGDKEVIQVSSKYTVLACGGIGGLFKSSTNERSITGLALAMASRHNIELKDVNYIQFHPTVLYGESTEKKFLLSESLRGEGGKLLDINNKSFVDELLPRNVVTAAIKQQEKKTKTPYVYLDIRTMEGEFIKERFPGIYNGCLERGIDVTKEKIPVTPAQHYFMGGIKVDTESKTSIKNLFACGEASCTGVHGANRLASNSLLESLVFSKRGANYINKDMQDFSWFAHVPEVCVGYEDLVKTIEENEELAIKTLKTYREDIEDELVSNR